ncbi:MAG: UDP-N-acetylmuramoylalanyl-D-glutamate--2,6-diaminopimelate ligase [Holophagaceae bacterium]|nr:UDP-N-acetylmuramoylalanyl-D-glutamate--2,6-diaminopimelate ligase [Holophagaceae bacterium]
MNFRDIVECLRLPGHGPLDVEVRDLTCDSREVGPGCVFVALKGEHSDGGDFIPKALERGAVGILGDRWFPDLAPDIAFARLDEARTQMATAARMVQGTPDERLALLGVTGTNGKTTTTMLIRQLLRGIGHGCGLIGTVLLAAGGDEEEATRTSPESPVFYRWIRKAADSGDRALAVEVSSHALSLARVHGARFRVGLFTNLTQDHLDFHGDLESYFQAKIRLFDQCEKGLVNADDPYGVRLLEEAPGLIGFGASATASYRLSELVLSPTGTSFRLEAPQGNWEIQSPLLGRFNVYNLVGALAVCAEAGFEMEALVRAVPSLKGAPGRLDRVDCGQAFGVMVDYAHTPDALEKLLAAGRDLLPPGGRLHVLFGCGGDRDRTKRAPMAAAVALAADVIWHTSDNSRSEDLEQILDDAALGIPQDIRNDAERYHRILDRALAVEAALAACRPGDLLLLAGKGHEPYQEILGQKFPYSDRGAVEAVLAGGSVPRPWAE